MKQFILSAAIGTLLAGCASTETGSVYPAADRTPVYGLDEQPQTAIVGEGTLMPGAYDTGQMPTGQFTGRERTVSHVGQHPVPPREADPRELSRAPEEGMGTGAGTLGQAGIQPGEPVTTDTILSSPTNPGLTPPAGAVNSPTMSSTPISAQPLTRAQDNPGPSGAIGTAPGAETSTSPTVSDPASAAAPPPYEELGAPPAQTPDAPLNTATFDLTERIREALSTSSPGVGPRLAPERVERFEIDAVNGNVTLRGDVRSESERLMIGNRVAQVEGVQSLNNQLRVAGQTRPGNHDANVPARRGADTADQ